MKVFWHKKEHNERVLLIFNGWGFDRNIFRDIDFPEHDIVSFSDYSDVQTTQFDFTKLYAEVKILAWSYGVFVADFYAENIYNLKKAIAVNGSFSPIDDKKGIPEKIFLATMQSFNERNREKFYIRIAGNVSAYKNMANLLPDRDVENQHAELKALYELSLQKRQNGLNWDLAIIAENDKIFPFENLKHAWSEKHTPIQSIVSEHIPFFETSFVETVEKFFGAHLRFSANSEKTLEKTLEKRIKQSFGKTLETYDENAYAQREIAEKLHSLILDYYPESAPAQIFEIGCGTGLLTKKILANFADANYYINDINGKVETSIRNLFHESKCEFLVGDAQIIDYPTNIDLIISSSTVQWFVNMHGFSAKAAKALSSKGYMFLSTFGQDNLKEIKEITGTGLQYPSMDELKNIFSTDFEILYSFEEEIPVSFDSPSEVLIHLKNTGVNANAKALFRTRKELDLFCKKYEELFSGKTKVKLTYNPVYLVLKKKNYE